MTTTRPAVAAIAVAATLLLAGCGSLIPSPDQFIEDTVENTIEDATGTSVDVGNAALPDSWPGLPTPDGTLVSSFAVEDTYSLTYTVSDDSKVEQLRDALIAEGFELTSEMSGELNSYVFTSSEWVVSTTWYLDDDGLVYLSYGAAVNQAG